MKQDTMFLSNGFTINEDEDEDDGKMIIIHMILSYQSVYVLSSFQGNIIKRQEGVNRIRE